MFLLESFNAVVWKMMEPPNQDHVGLEAAICLGFASQFVWILIQYAVLTDTEDRKYRTKRTERCASFWYNP